MKTVTTVIEIAAPVETVWAQLIDASSYADWNPFITRLDGALVDGSTVDVRIAPPGGRPMSFRPKITEVEDGKRLAWLGRLVLPGVFDGRHSFNLEAIEKGRTRLTQSEQFSGLLVAIMGKKMVERTRDGFEAMNHALRLRAESSVGRPVK